MSILDCTAQDVQSLEGDNVTNISFSFITYKCAQVLQLVYASLESVPLIVSYHWLSFLLNVWALCFTAFLPALDHLVLWCR